MSDEQEIIVMKRRQIGECRDLYGRAAPTSVCIVEKLSRCLVVDQTVVRIQSLGAEHKVFGRKTRWIDGGENLVIKHDLVTGAFREVLDLVDVVVSAGLEVEDESIGSSSAVQDIVAVAADELVVSCATRQGIGCIVAGQHVIFAATC